MANVPYDTGVSAEPFPTVAPRGAAPDDTLKVRATPEETGGLVAQGLQQAGAGATKAGLFFGQAAADNASNDFQDSMDKILHGDVSKTVIGPDGQSHPDTGYFGLQGRAALDARPAVEQKMDEALKQIRDGLTTPEQQLQFDNFSRRSRSIMMAEMGRHADQQANTWYKQVNGSTAALALNGIAQNPDNLELFQAGTQKLVSARIKQVQLEGGDQTQLDAAIADAKAQSVAARTRSIAVKDPARAMKVLDSYKNMASVVDARTGASYYDTLSNEFRGRAEQQTGLTAAADATTRTAGPTQTASAAYNFFLNKGYSPAAAAGIVGNLVAESGMRTDVPGDHGTSGGLAQFHNERLAALKTFAQQQGKPWTDFQTQLEFVDHELHSTEGGAFNALRVATTPEEAASAFASQYERPQSTDYSARQSAARSVFSGSSGDGVASAHRAAATRDVMTNPDLNPNEREWALREINRTFTEAQIAAEANTKARKDANDAARDDYTTQIFQTMQSNPQGLTALQRKIEADPRLEGPTKIALSNYMTAKTGTDEGMSFGTAYSEVYKRIFLPPGDPQRINDPNDILVAGSPGGGLTPKGTDRLMGIWRASRKDPDQMAVNQTKTALIQYAKSKLSFDQETLAPGFQLKDPKGAQIFDSQFVPKFESAYDAWIKQGKNPWEFLTQENIDKLMVGMRPKSQMQMDRIAAVGETSGDKADQTVPTAPAGINETSWQGIMANRPLLKNGNPLDPNDWAQAVQKLRENPQLAPYFDQKWKGFAAKDILEKLGAPVIPAAQPNAPVAHREPETGDLSYQGNVPVKDNRSFLQRNFPTMLPPEMRPQ